MPIPLGMVALLLGMFHASRRGEFAVTVPALGDLIGRSATPISLLLEQVTTQR